MGIEKRTHRFCLSSVDISTIRISVSKWSRDLVCTRIWSSSNHTKSPYVLLVISTKCSQQTQHNEDRLTWPPPAQPFPWPWRFQRLHAFTGHEIGGRWEGLRQSVNFSLPPRPWRSIPQVPSWCAAAIGLLLHSEGKWPDSFPLRCLGKSPFLRKEQDDTCLFPHLAITALNAHVLQWLLSYLLKLYMASSIWNRCHAWHMFTQEHADHSKFPQGENLLISLLRSNPQHFEFCRWQPDETAVDLSPEGLDTPSQASPARKNLYLGCPQGLICCPLNGMHSVTQPIHTLKLPVQWGGPPVLLLMALFPTQQRKMAKNIK